MADAKFSSNILSIVSTVCWTVFFVCVLVFVLPMGCDFLERDHKSALEYSLKRDAQKAALMMEAQKTEQLQLQLKIEQERSKGK